MHFLKARNKGLVVTNSNFELTPNLQTNTHRNISQCKDQMSS